MAFEKAFAPAAERNRDPILRVLSEVLPSSGLVLEIGSGTGQHAAYFSQSLPHLQWQPTEYDTTRFESICAWLNESGASNVHPVAYLDAQSDTWPVQNMAAVFCANVIHISPWTVTEGIFRGVQKRLEHGGCLIFYGPFRFDGLWTAPSNQVFDERLRSMNPDWGVRDIAEIKRVAQLHEFELDHIFDCPANNHCIVFRRQKGSI